MKYNLDTDLRLLKNMFPTVAEAFNLEFLKGLSAGKTMINEQEFCIRTGYNMRPIPEQFFESHQEYIDIHITLEGTETFAVTPINQLNTTSEYDQAGDCILYDRKSNISQLLTTHENGVVVFNVSDGHMTAIGDVEDKVEKVIIKVLVENISN